MPKLNEPHSMQPSEVKRLHGWVKLFLLATIASGLMSIFHGLHARFDPQYLIRPGRVTHVHIGGQDFAVPDEYIRGPRPDVSDNRLYIWLTLPDYKPYQGTYAERENPKSIGSRLITVLIDDMANAPDFKSRYEMVRNGPLSIYHPKDVQDIYGLHRTLIYYSNARVSEPFIDSDLYYQTSANGDVNGFIICSPDKPPPQGASCTDLFQNESLVYQIGYGKENLGQWQGIETHVSDLIKSFSCVPNKNQPLTKESAKICPR